MYDDPGLFLDALLIIALGGVLSFILIAEWLRAWRLRRVDIPTALGGLSILSFLWFLAWMVTGGIVPFGLWAFGAAGSFLVAIPVAVRLAR